MSQVIEDLFNAILEGNADLAEDRILRALSSKIDPSLILNQGMIASMAEVGERFERGEYFVPEMLVAARAMQQGLSILKPHLLQSDFIPAGKVVIGTVKGDLHDIGKNIVGMMLEGAGFELLDLGTDVPAGQFIDAVRENGADIIALSALLTTTMPQMKTVIDALGEAELRGRVKVVVGGAPVTESYAQEIGADGYAADANRAVKITQYLLT